MTNYLTPEEAYDITLNSLKNFEENWSQQVKKEAKEILDNLEDLPEISLETDSFDDLYEWGKWVAKKGNLTPEKSRELLRWIRNTKEEEDVSK